jgi:hypothetical protein
VLLATLSETLANALRTKLRRLISNEPRLAERLEVPFHLRSGLDECTVFFQSGLLPEPPPCLRGS